LARALPFQGLRLVKQDEPFTPKEEGTVQQATHPTDYPLAVVPVDLRFLALGLLDLPARPECRPTVYRPTRHALGLTDDERRGDGSGRRNRSPQ
jgi:hypothetical protein